MNVSSLLQRLFKWLRISGWALTLAGLIMILTILAVAILAPWIAPYDPVYPAATPLQPPSSQYPMGTTGLGFDVFSRIIYGARTILLVVLLSSALSGIIGIPLGLISGYIGGVLDRVLSLVMDSIYSFPGLILAIAVAAAIGPGVYNAAIAIAFVYVPTYFRMVRGQVLYLREQLYVDAARAMGAKSTTIIKDYIFPNLVFVIVIVFSLGVADAALTEAGLSFLGLTITSHSPPDWGFDLKYGQPFLPAGYWWLSLFPGLMVIVLTVGFSLLGEGLSELLSPRLRAR